MAHFTLGELEPWIEARFDPASGPGGQHVNKASTRATLLFDFQACPRLSPAQRARIAQHCATRLSADGRLRVVAQQSRTQSDNRRLAGERLLELLAAALHVPRPRRPTTPTAGARRRRLEAKHQRARTKERRRGAAED